MAGVRGSRPCHSRHHRSLLHLQPPPAAFRIGPGGFVRRGSRRAAFYPASGNFPAEYHNSYFFADYPFYWARRIDTVNPGDAYAFATNLPSPVDLLVGMDGALYVLKLDGSITRISVP